jgi:BirA family biotin operon repressor/biotin-[acetyl-CoA-carboxylase] ligase
MSNPGENLCFSIIVYPHFLQPNQQFYLSMCVATAIAKVLENEKMGNVKLKWPNDLYIGPLKTGGISNCQSAARTQMGFVCYRYWHQCQSNLL